MKTIRSFLLALFMFLGGVPAVFSAVEHQQPIVFGPTILMQHATPYAGHGVAGDDTLIFNIEIQPPDISNPMTRIGVYTRFFNKKVGELTPAGPQPWTIPMSIKTESFSTRGRHTRGSVYVLEVGLISPNQPPLFHRMIKYKYSYSPKKGFLHQIVDVGYLPLLSSPPGELPNGLALPENFDFVTTTNGKRHIVISDAIVGAIWSTETTNLDNWRLDLISPDFGPTPLTRVCELDGDLIIGYCGLARGPNWTIEYYVQAMWQPVPGVDLLPGPFGLTYVGPTNKVAFNNVGTGTIYQIDPDLLLDPTLPPFPNTKPYEVLLAPIPGVSDMQGSLIWDRWHPNTHWLYWQRIISTPEERYFPIYRVNIFNGEVQLVAESIWLFDHPSMLSVLPTRGLPITSLVTSNTQERNMAFTNRLISESHLVAPSIVTITNVLIPFLEWQPK